MSAIDNLKSKKWHELTNAETVVVFYYDQYSDNDGDKAIAEQAAAELARLQAIEAETRMNQAQMESLITVNDELHDKVNAVTDALSKHRKEAFVTCDESCFCWDVEAALDAG
jgi:hypothetical protein